jgi:hypothetical protein
MKLYRRIFLTCDDLNTCLGCCFLNYEIRKSRRCGDDNNEEGGSDRGQGIIKSQYER